jgi:hypothetical protein
MKALTLLYIAEYLNLIIGQGMNASINDAYNLGKHQPY